MNKKLATLMFAIGLGTAAAPAFASCEFYCNRALIACLNSGEAADVCYADQEACSATC